MKNKKGFTLIELQVSFVVASVLVLAIAAIAQISTQSYNKYLKQTQLYNDVMVGLKMVQSKVHESSNSPTVESVTEAEWIEGEQLVVDNQAFAIYQESADATKDFVYWEDIADEDDREVLLSVANDETLNLFLTQNANRTTVRLQGERDEIAFDLTTDVVRRVQ